MLTQSEQKVKLFVATFADKAVWQVDTLLEQLVKEVVELETKKHLEEISRHKKEIDRLGDVCDRMERELETNN
jgi:hypothetical protein